MEVGTTAGTAPLGNSQSTGIPASYITIWMDIHCGMPNQDHVSFVKWTAHLQRVG